MRRVISGAVIVVVSLLGLGFFVWRVTQKKIAGSQIAPEHSLFYAEVPNLPETLRRWPDTAISQIFNEPSVQRFAKLPLSKIPPTFQKTWSSLERLRCSGLFVCVADSDRESWIVGVRTPVDRSVVRDELNTLARNLFGTDLQVINPSVGQNPAVRGGLLMALAQDWILLGRNSQTLLEAVHNAEAGTGGIQVDPLFQECRGKAIAGYDFLSFIRGGPSFDISKGRAWALPRDERNGDIKAILSTTTIDGAKFRDMVFTCRQVPPASGLLEERGLDMSSPRTVAFLTSRVGLSELWQITDQFARFSQIAETMHGYLDQARSFGIDPQNLDALISAATIVVDRDSATDAVSASFSFRVNDPDKFKPLIDEIVARKFPDSCEPIQVGGVPAYVIKGNATSDVVFGLTGHEFLITWNAATFAELLQRLQTKENGLEKNENYRSASKLVSQPTDLFMYVDTKTAFERCYDAVRPMLVFGAAFVPTLGDYIDSTALPDTNQISRHLTPIVLSRHRLPDGIVDESAGPVTAYQALALVLATGVALGVLQHQ
jgi:hypothetical protein